MLTPKESSNSSIPMKPQLKIDAETSVSTLLPEPDLTAVIHVTGHVGGVGPPPLGVGCWTQVQ